MWWFLGSQMSWCTSDKTQREQSRQLTQYLALSLVYLANNKSAEGKFLAQLFFVGFPKELLVYCFFLNSNILVTQRFKGKTKNVCFWIVFYFFDTIPLVCLQVWIWLVSTEKKAFTYKKNLNNYTITYFIYIATF